MTSRTNNFLVGLDGPPRPRPPPVRKDLEVDDSSDDEDACSVPESMAPATRPGSARAAAAAARAAKTASLSSSSPTTSDSSGPRSAFGGQGTATSTRSSPNAAPSKGLAAMNLHEEPEESSISMGTLNGRHRLATSTPAPSPAPPSYPAPLPGGTTQGLLGSRPPSFMPSRRDYQLHPAQQQQPQVVEGLRSQARAQPRYPATHSVQDEEQLVEEDVEVDGSASFVGLGAPGRQAGSGLGALLAGGSSLPPDVARGLRSILWGSPTGLPPDSWKQGFFYCYKPGLQFGLVQAAGGPCGVLAAVQGHILTRLFKGGSFNLDPSPQEQEAALAEALTDILWQARTSAAATLTLPAAERGMDPQYLGYEQLMRSLVVVRALSKEALQSQLSKCLPYLMSECGWGIILVLLSLVLTRGIDVVKEDMDETLPLSAMHGYCTQELVNLILVGQAVSNVFDGVRDLDGAKLKGITCRCRIGFLSLFEWYKNTEVGRCLKNPELPVWVVCAESHFTVLFAQDSRPLRGIMPFNLFFYDKLANQDEVITLTIKPDPQGGWTARVGDSYGDRGRCEGQNIPPLECVIETRWPGVLVDWNGMDPIL